MVTRTEDVQLIFSTIAQYRRWVAAEIPGIVPDTDVSYQQINVLYLVRTANASMADMARALNVAPTVITGLVDRLETRGLISRQPHPTDRRRVQLVLTERGNEISQQVEEAVSARINEQIAKLSPSDQQKLREGLRLLQSVTAQLEQSVESTGAPSE
ncbi:MAG: MarR family transcriptional regulator [Thermomicrobiales bacterium]|nr:MarR family transcriptional regulator [Thermomicrobiales bacterium]MCO5222251.1 MarR family transcriptional regulator [Thermomicrobiales bacterium]